VGKYKRIIRWIVMSGCLAYIVWFFAENRQELAQIARINPVYLGLMGVLFLTAHLIYSFRSRIILTKCSGIRLALWPWFRLAVLGRFLSTFIPQAGNIYISIRLKREYKIPYTHYAGSFFSFVWLDTCLNMVYAVLVVLLVRPDLMLGNLRALPVLIVIAIGIAAGPPLLVLISRKISFVNRRLVWLHAKLSEMLRLAVISIGDARYTLKVIGTGLLAFTNSLLLLYLSFRSLGMEVNMPALALFYVLLKISTEILITPGNIGPREIAYGILSELMGIGMAQGIAVSVIIRVLGTGTVMILGSCFGGIDLLRHKEDYTEQQ
jgi:uncharacterized membrane protein YbhN (UPF0104 family)